MTPAAILRALETHPARRGEELFRVGALNCRVDAAGKWAQLRGPHVGGYLGHTLAVTAQSWSLREAGTVRYVRAEDADERTTALATMIMKAFEEAVRA